MATFNMNLDPLSQTLSRAKNTGHIVGDDEGKGLVDFIFKHHKQHIAAKQRQGANVTTLADVPFCFLHIEVDGDGKIVPEKVDASGQEDSQPGRRGTLGDYLTQDGDAGRWSHPGQPATYGDDFPFSVDNFDCQRLVADLEDDCDLRALAMVRWVLWLGVARSRGTTVMTLENRWRITSVGDLLGGLNEVRKGLQGAQPEESSGGPVVLFVVAASYECRMDKPPKEAARRKGPLPSVLANARGLIAQLSRPGRVPEVTAGRNRRDSASSSSILDHDYELLDDLDQLEEELEEDTEYSRRADERWLRDPSIRYGVNLLRLQPMKWEAGMLMNGKTLTQADVDKAQAEFIEQTEWPFLTRRDSMSDSCCSSDSSLPELPEDLTLLEDLTLSESGGEGGEEEEEEEEEEEKKEKEETTPSILATLDTNVGKGDAIEGDLHALLPEATSPSTEAWQRCCALLCLDAQAHGDAQARSIRVPGTEEMWVTPCQLWTAYWMLTSRTGRDLSGGVLADVMGTGKTYVCLLVCLLRAYIGYSRSEVERDWQLREHEAKKGGGAAPKQHLPRDCSAEESTPCPCGNALGIECYANPGGVTRQIADGLTRGVSLILAPQTVLDNWVRTIKQVRLQAKFYEPVVFHGKMAKEDTVLAPAPRLKQKLQMEVRPQGGADGQFPASWQPSVYEAAYRFTPSTAKDAFPERFLFLATHVPEKLTEFFQVAAPVRRSKTGNSTTRERKTVYGCPVGIQLVDEFHKAKEAVVALAQQHKHLRQGDFDFWAITGTPVPAKLTDLAPVVELVQRLPAWDAPTSRHHGGRVADLQALQAAYERAVAADGTAAQAAEVRQRAERFFSGGLVMRHTEASLFGGQRIFCLQDVTPTVVVHRTPEAFRADVGRVVARVAQKLREAMGDSNNNWEQVVRSGALFNHMMDLEILATFPGAARLMLADPPVLDFSLGGLRAEMRRMETRDAAAVPLFQQHLDAVVQDSPHLAAVLAMLDEMEGDPQRRRLAKQGGRPVKAGGDARRKKLVVLCPRMGEAVFMYLALQKRRPDLRPVFLHGDLRLAERTALLQTFQQLGGASSSHVLVGTFRDAGTGNDLSAASYQVLTGPLRLRSQQDQAFGRTNREGQTLRLHHRLLLTEDSPVDRLVVATQARRRLASDPFAMGEAVRLEGEESLISTV